MKSMHHNMDSGTNMIVAWICVAIIFATDGDVLAGIWFIAMAVLHLLISFSMADWVDEDE